MNGHFVDPQTILTALMLLAFGAGLATGWAL